MRRKKKKGIGCCGYDELAYKPATTRPILAINLSTRRQRKNVGGFGNDILFPLSNVDGPNA